ncbi:hypothetical protein JW859_11055 [bacterium]|nr:hypothetical protein [bacterium]
MGGIKRMEHMRCLLVSLAAMPLVFLTYGCSGSIEEDSPIETGDSWAVAHVLYVEEVILPDAIYEGNDVYFQLRVSAEANVTALNRLSFNNWAKISGVYALYGSELERWMIDAVVDAESDLQTQSSDLLEVMMPAMPVGEWECVIRCAANRSLGGGQYQYRLGGTPSPIVPVENIKEIRFTVNVVERPEE